VGDLGQAASKKFGKSEYFFENGLDRKSVICLSGAGGVSK
jgi:hypothetical protein